MLLTNKFYCCTSSVIQNNYHFYQLTKRKEEQSTKIWEELNGYDVKHCLALPPLGREAVTPLSLSAPHTQAWAGSCARRERDFICAIRYI